ncbi:DUF2760 domain-containing protein [Methylovulum miyakonense]|uniref:DUF2760 domain-containing protein n=1 Tax=Methylovulum miyakonense TaxID=645578 RepID=UPI00037416A8|nr:DUF2760 domain-containing protein [Methylovulum miyakonense]
MNNQYTIDLTLQPTTFDLWHVGLAGAVMLLSLTLLILLLAMVISLSRGRKPSAGAAIIQPPAEPIVKVVEVEKIVEVEKVVEVEKIVHAPAPEPVILKEATPDAALQLLGLLQKEARFLDFIKENITAYSDADIGIAARVVHEGCNKALNDHFSLAPVRSEAEGSKITVQPGFDAGSIRLTGNIVGSAPFTGTLIHKGWQVTDMRLPKLTQGHNAAIVAAAEVEL